MEKGLDKGEDKTKVLPCLANLRRGSCDTRHWSLPRCTCRTGCWARLPPSVVPQRPPTCQLLNVVPNRRRIAPRPNGDSKLPLPAIGCCRDRTSQSRAHPVSTHAPLRPGRSEEHTSELQSRQYLVCRLLLEKKKNSERELRLYISN